MEKLNRLILCAVVVNVAVLGSSRLYAEHQEHAGKEPTGTTAHGGVTPAVAVLPQSAVSAPSAVPPTRPTNEEIRAAMQSYALRVTDENGGFFPIHDEKTGADRKLTFQQVHQRVGKLSTRNGYFSCADFVDQATGEALDLDFWVTMEGEKLEVTATEIHKVGGNPRFTYNDKDEKIILN